MVFRWIAQLQQKYTQRGGVRPFGVSMLLAGFDPDGKPQLYKTEPSGAYSSWKAASTGKGEKTLRDYLDTVYEPDFDDSVAVKIAIRALLDVADGGSKNIEVVLLRANKSAELLSDKKLGEIAAEIEKEKQAEAEAKRIEASA